MLTDTLAQMPGWSLFLIFGPLLMLITFGFLYEGFEEERNSCLSCERKSAWNMIIVLGILYPLAWVLLILASLIELTRFSDSKIEQFSKYLQREHKAYQLSRKLPPAKPPRPALIHLAKKGGTRCGVGALENVKTTPHGYQVTCDVYKDLM